MMSVYVISHKHIIRSRELEMFLVKQNMDFELVADSDADGLDFKISSSELTRALINRDMSDEEYSCAFAHFIALSKFVASKSASALILEDDVVPLRNVSPILKILDSSTSPTIIQLHTDVTSKIPLGQTLRVLKPSDGSYAYVLNRTAAKNILKNYLQYGLCVPSDFYFPLPSGTRFLLSTRAYFAHPLEGMASYIEASRRAVRDYPQRRNGHLSRYVGLEDYTKSRVLKVPFYELYKYRIFSRFQEEFLNKIYSISKSFVSLND